MTGSPLERDLARLSVHVAFPEAPELAERVVAHLEAAPRRPHRRPALVSRPVWVLAGLALVLAIVGMLAVPPAREAVADWLGIGAVRVERVAAIDTAAQALDLGAAVDLAEARAGAGFPVLVPDLPGPPEGVFRDTAGRITLVWSPSELIPATDAGVGMLLGQFPGSALGFLKQAPPDVEIPLTNVGRRDALWLEGGPHAIFYVDDAGEARTDTGRIAGNTLIWEANGATYRLEADVPLALARRIAESAR